MLSIVRQVSSMPKRATKASFVRQASIQREKPKSVTGENSVCVVSLSGFLLGVSAISLIGIFSSEDKRSVQQQISDDAFLFT